MDHKLGLDGLPTEIILGITDHLSLHDLNSVFRTAKRLGAIVSPQLFSLGAVHVARNTSPLIWSVQQNHLSTIEKLLDKGANPSIAVGSTTAFHEAIRHGGTEALELCLQTGAKPSQRNKWNHTPLQQAVLHNQVPMIRMILDACPEINPSDDEEWSEALKLAVMQQDVDAARCLLENASQVMPVPISKPLSEMLLLATASGKPSLVQLLIRFGWGLGRCGAHYDTPLHIAAEKGNLALVEMLLSYGSDVNACDRHHYTPLQRAVCYGCVEVVRYLIGAGADVHKTTMVKDTALHQSARDGTIQIAEMLLNAGVAPNATNAPGDTPLFEAVQGGDIEMMELLLRSGANPSATNGWKRSLLYMASAIGNAHTVQLLLEYGADTQTDSLGPLRVAAQDGCTTVIQPLVDAGFDINSTATGDWFPLWTATRYNHVETMREIIRCGANIHLLDRKGRSAVFATASHQSTSALELLLEAGADVTIRTDDGTTILHDAAYQSAASEVVQLMIDHGADAFAVGPNGTALHYAALGQYRYSPIRLLLRAGIDVEARNKNGETALHIAAKDTSRDVWDLLHAGADVNARAANGSTPLHCAASASDSSIYTMLLDSGADITARDMLNCTPLHTAATAGNAVLFNKLHELYKKNRLNYMARCNTGKTVVEHAVMSGGTDVLEQIDEDVNYNKYPDHGKHRGIPALHYAVLNYQEDTVQHLLQRGADPIFLDVHGQTAMDWASTDESGSMLQLLQDETNIAYTPTPTAQRNAILKTSIVGLASCLLTGESVEYDKLGKCLYYLGDIPTAWIAHAQDIEACCEICRRQIPPTEKRFLCTLCPKIDLCAPCMAAESDIEIGLCHHHDFVDVVLADYTFIALGFSADDVQSARMEWLEGLIETYRV
ncbi:ankyrin repeat-containing domain protein [Aspergillus californicus]